MPLKLKNSFLEQQVHYESLTALEKIEASHLNGVVTHLENYIVVRTNNEIKVYDRICDHNRGRLITGNDGVTKCPLHGWTFEPLTGQYTNVNCIKSPILVKKDKDVGDVLEIPASEKRRVLPNFTSAKNVRIRYFNHASVIIELEGLKIGLDPWLLGPAFCRGWWLANPSPTDAIDEFASCDLIYISHNHPDHLHDETLRLLPKKTPFITAGFQSGSSKARLQELGFSDIQCMDFGSQYVSEKDEFSISSLKSGDFRDDSGLLIQSGQFSALFTVDSNYLDFFRFPRELTFLATSFASGASGFPLCFDNLSDRQKDFIISRNRNSIKHINSKLIELCKTSYYMPYAGMFKEQAERDLDISLANIKNKIEDFRPICEAAGAELLNVTQHDEFEFLGSKLLGRNDQERNRMPVEKPQDWIAAAKNKFQPLSQQQVTEYFRNSHYHGDLILIVEQTDDAFGNICDEWIEIHFSGSSPTIKFVKMRPVLADLHKRTGKNILHLKIRQEAFSEVLEGYLPWEDFSIGFQLRVDRIPDKYNSSFWHHFTNVYTGRSSIRATAECSACESFLQKTELVVEQ